MTKMEIIAAMKSLKKNFAISLRKGDDYIVLGMWEGAGKTLHALMTAGWEVV
jgi:hypothetical protein